MSGLLRPGVVGATRESYPLFRCPRCGRSGVIDEDQFRGRVSVQCPHEGCVYHETRDWSANDA